MDFAGGFRRLIFYSLPLGARMAEGQNGTNEGIISFVAEAARRRVTFWTARKSPMAQATLSCPFGAIHLENR